MVTKRFLLLVIFAIGYGKDIKAVNRFRRQYQACSLSQNQNYGVCVKWSECKSGQEDFSNRKVPPIYCSYDAKDPVVCCAESGVQKTNDILPMPRKSDEECNKIYSSWRKPVPSVNPTVPGEFRHMAAIGWKKANGSYNFRCGGTLISENFVLTAAHCSSLDEVPPEVIRIGGNWLNETDENMPIMKIYVHPQYTSRQIYHDIALLEVPRYVRFPPACLWPAYEIENLETVAIGYGHTTFGGQGSNSLLEASLSVLSPKECMRNYKPGFKLEDGITETLICAADRRNIQSACQGDSGGPLLAKLRMNRTDFVIPYILGITSYGQGCASGPPSLYTRVSSYLDWIESIVWPEQGSLK